MTDVYGWTTEHSASSYGQPVLVFGGTLCDTLADYALASVSDWLTAAGDNDDSDVDRWLAGDRDALARDAYADYLAWYDTAVDRGDVAPPRLTVALVRDAIDAFAADRGVHRV